MKIPPKQAPNPEALKSQFQEVANLYEKHFLREITKAMRSTVPESGFIKKNNAERIFQEQLDGEYVEKWGARGGIGLADLIYKQLVEKFAPHLGPTEALQTQGPFPFKENDRLRLKVSENPKGLNFTIQASDPGSLGSGVLRAPWSGLLSKKIELAPSEWFLQLQHDNGLTSRFTYKGLGPKFDLHSRVEAGQGLGFLSPDGSSLRWGLISKRD